MSVNVLVSIIALACSVLAAIFTFGARYASITAKMDIMDARLKRIEDMFTLALKNGQSK